MFIFWKQFLEIKLHLNRSRNLIEIEKKKTFVKIQTNNETLYIEERQPNENNVVKMFQLNAVRICY